MCCDKKHGRDWGTWGGYEGTHKRGRELSPCLSLPLGARKVMELHHRSFPDRGMQTLFFLWFDHLNQLRSYRVGMWHPEPLMRPCCVAARQWLMIGTLKAAAWQGRSQCSIMHWHPNLQNVGNSHQESGKANHISPERDLPGSWPFSLTQTTSLWQIFKEDYAENLGF